MKNSVKRSLVCLLLLTINSYFLISMDLTPQRTLYRAIWTGDIAQAREAIKQGAKINDISLREVPLLGIALSRPDNQAELVELLLANGANVNMDNNALRIIGYLSQLEPKTVQILLAYGLNLNQENMPVQTAEEFMASGYPNYHTTMQEQLEKKGPQIKKIVEDYVNLLKKIRSSNNPKVLHEALNEAIANDYHSLVWGLIDQRKVPVNKGDLQLARGRYSERSYRIISKQLQLPETLQRALYLAVSTGNVVKAKEAIKQGANVNDISIGGFPLLGIALQNNQAELVEILLENGANVNMNGNALGVIRHLKQQLEPRTVQALLAYGLNLYQENMCVEDATGELALFGHTGYTTMREQLEKKGPQIKKIVDEYVSLLEKVKSSDREVLKSAFREAIANDYHPLTYDLIRRGVPVNESDLKLAKEHGSKRSGRIILNQLRLTSPVGGVCKPGAMEAKTGLSTQLLDQITRFTH